MKSYLTIIGPNSHEKFGFIYPYLPPKYIFLSIFSITYLQLPLFSYIWPNLALITLILSYLPFIPVIWPYVPYSPYICIILLGLHLCAIFKSIGQLFMEILHFQRIGACRKCCHECSLGVCLVIDNCVYVSSHALDLCQIVKQSDNWLWRYCISKIWGIQCRHEFSCSSARKVSNFNNNVPLGISTLI